MVPVWSCGKHGGADWPLGRAPSAKWRGTEVRLRSNLLRAGEEEETSYVGRTNVRR